MDQTPTTDFIITRRVLLEQTVRVSGAASRSDARDRLEALADKGVDPSSPGVEVVATTVVTLGDSLKWSIREDKAAADPDAVTLDQLFRSGRLSTRAVNAAREAIAVHRGEEMGIRPAYTVSALAEIRRGDLVNRQGAGKGTIQEIDDLMAEFGLTYAAEAGTVPPGTSDGADTTRQEQPS